MRRTACHAGDHGAGAADAALAADLDQVSLERQRVCAPDGTRGLLEVDGEPQVLPLDHLRGPGRGPVWVHVEAEAALGVVLPAFVARGGPNAGATGQGEDEAGGHEFSRGDESGGILADAHPQDEPS